MSQSIFPVEITEHSVEQHWAEHSTRSQVVYLSIIIFILVAVAALPFIYVDISVQSSGLVRPIAEKTEIKSPTAGYVSEVLISDNESVRKDQPLLLLQTDLVDQQLSFNEDRSKKTRSYQKDLRELIRIDLLDTASSPLLSSSLYTQTYQEFSERAREIRTRITQAKKDYQRAALLAQNQVIARREVEERKLTLDIATDELHLLVARQRNQWQQALQQHHDELAELVTDQQRLNREKEQFYLVAPKNGTIQNFSGIYPGGYVFANQTIAELSPDSLLIVESLVPPSDIGLLQVDMPVIFQVDAFNYNQWGIVHGKVLSISSDIIVVNDQPAFKVRSTLDQSYLTLKNGYRGQLKKGMTVRARFRISERSIYQLLYDKVDNWLNPIAVGNEL